MKKTLIGSNKQYSFDMKLHHVGIACHDIHHEVKKYKKLPGVISISDITYDKNQDIYVCFIELEEQPNIELVSGNKVKAFFMGGSAIYHECFEVDNIDNAISESINQGATLILPKTPATLFDNRFIAFIKFNGRLIEFIEINNISNQYTTEIIIASSFCTLQIRNNLIKYFSKLNFSPKLIDYDYNSFIYELYNLNINNSDSKIIIFLLRMQDLYSKNNTDESALSSFLSLLHNITKTNAPTILYFVPEALTPSGTQTKQSIINQYINTPNIYILQNNTENDFSFIKYYYRSQSDLDALIPYNQMGSEIVSLKLTRKIYNIIKNPYKVIVVDCDNTLWEGSCSELGYENISINESNHDLQRFLIEKHNQGYIICLCSKNIESDVLNVFENNHSMLLSLQHITAYKINWNSKYENMKELSTLLNLNLSSFIFIDDNILEIQNINTNHPDILCIHFSPNLENVYQYFTSIWAFDKHSISRNDRHRHLYYKHEKYRREHKRSFDTLDKFIKSLKIKIILKSCNTYSDYQELQMLSKRVNQFNCTGLHIESYIINQPKQDSKEYYIIKASDIFGDYGNIGGIIYSLNETTCIIHNYFLSCRILGKHIELNALKIFCNVIKKLNINVININFIENARNIPAKCFLERIPNTLKSKCCYIFPIDTLINLNKLPENKNEEIIINHNINLNKNTIYLNNKIMLEFSQKLNILTN